MEHQENEESKSDDTPTKRKRFLSKRVLLILAGFIFLIIALNLLAYVRYLSEDQYSGRIVAVSGESFIIENPRGDQVAIVVSDTTKVWMGRDAVGRDALRVGTFVMVFGAKENERIVSERINILDEHPPLPRR